MSSFRPRGTRLGFDVGDEAVLVFAVGQFLDRARRGGHRLLGFRLAASFCEG